MEELIKKMNFADKVASRSKDQSTKVGAVFIDEEETHPISFGYNGMPRGLDDSHIERNERPEKYIWYEHAERNAIYNAARPILQDKIIFSSHFPNMESARGIVSSGIKEVITDVATFDKEDPMTKRVLKLFEETKVKLELIDLVNHPKTFEKFVEEHNLNSNSNETHIDTYKKVYSKIDKMAYYLDLAKEYGETQSISSTRKQGSLIMDKEYYNPIAAGVYGPPANLTLTEEIKNNEELFFQEDVKNAIFNAVRSKLKNSIADVTWCPCQKCALAIVAVGSKKVRTRKPDFTKENDLRWKPEFEKSQTIFSHSNTVVELLEVPNLEDYKKPKGGLKTIMRKIVLDTDGVILNFGDNYVNFAEKILGKKLNHNIAKYPLQDLLQVNTQEADYVWEQFNKLNEWERIPPFKDVEKAIEIINDFKLEVYIVTSIDEQHKLARKKNLNSIGLYPKEIICVGANHGHKNKVITEINPVAFADDRLDHLHRSQDVEHLVWIDQKQEQIMSFDSYHARVESLYQWTSDFLPAIMNEKSFKNENNKKEIVFEQWNNSNLTVFNYWKQVQNDNTLSNEDLESAQNLTNTIFNIRKTSTQNIDKLFIDMFNVDGVNNTMNLANQMGADIGGIEGNDVKVIFMNCEFGVNIHLVNPKSEDANKYLKIFELFNLGLENTEQYKKVLAYYHLDETFESKPKIKQHKI